MDNLVCCIECFELVDYEDAIYKNDDITFFNFVRKSIKQKGLTGINPRKDDSMLCLECYVKNIIHQ